MIVTIAVVALLAFVIASTRYSATWWGPGYSYVGFGSGGMGIGWRTGGSPGATVKPAKGWDFQRYHPLSFTLWFRPYSQAFNTGDGYTYHYVTIVLWWALLALGPVAARLWVIDRTPRAGCCPNCAYNLAGNTSGVCPECGAKAQQAGRP